MTTDQLRAEAAMVQQEAGGEMTTRAALLLAAADEIDRINFGRMKFVDFVKKYMAQMGLKELVICTSA